MIDVKVKFLSLLADFTKEEEYTITVDDNSTIKDIIDKLTQKYGARFKDLILNSPDLISKYIILGLNGEDIRSQKGLETLIQEGDEIAFLPAIAGG